MFSTIFRFFKGQPIPVRILERVKQLEIELVELREEHHKLELMHQKLSGRFYSRFGKGEGDSTAPLQISSKNDLRRLAGITAGRPAIHRG